jgi:UDP-2,3-diacylglucosamine hydrolase
MKKHTLIISDLHLQQSEPETAAFFTQFMDSQAPAADALYILGDFFEFWIGDDDQTPFHQEVIGKLRQLSDQGIPVYFMRGNRDFLIGETFAQQAGLTLLEDPCLVNFYGENVLLCHGDTLCTLDIKYQKFRKKTQNRFLRRCFLTIPLKFRRKIALSARAKSQRHTKDSNSIIMDVTPEEVVLLMSRNNVQRLIHGHTHRPAVHKITVNNQSSERIVLGSWHHSPSVLTVYEDGKYELSS